MKQFYFVNVHTSKYYHNLQIYFNWQPFYFELFTWNNATNWEKQNVLCKLTHNQNFFIKFPGQMQWEPNYFLIEKFQTKLWKSYHFFGWHLENIQNFVLFSMNTKTSMDDVFSDFDKYLVKTKIDILLLLLAIPLFPWKLECK